VRGRNRTGNRGGTRPIQVQPEVDAQKIALPCPYNGWNAVGNPADMKPLDAYVLDNCFPGVQSLTLRPGSTSWRTGAPGNIRSLLSYQAQFGGKLFAATNTGIYDATNAGAFGSSLLSCSNGRWRAQNFATPGGQFLIGANGTDPMFIYDGTSFYSVTGVSTPYAITGVNTSNISQLLSHKVRLWMIQEGTMNLWYLPVESIAGAASVFPVGHLFKKGGSLVAMGTWSLDSGAGPDDFFIIVTTMGELAVYQGTDPSSSSTWALVGVFDCPPPLGNKCFCDYGGDLLYLSQNGILPLSKLMQSVVIDHSLNVSFQIDGAFLAAAQTYGSNPDWDMVVHKSASALIVNIPVATDSVSYQFVMNTITKAWCRFTGWNASCLAEYQGNFFFASGHVVYQGWSGVSDSGSAIQGTIAQAYNNFGSNSGLQITSIMPYIQASGQLAISYAVDTDFVTSAANNLQTYQIQSAAWDISLWDQAEWSSTGDINSTDFVVPQWMTVPSKPGFMHSLRMQITSSTGNIAWTATQLLVKPAGFL